MKAMLIKTRPYLNEHWVFTSSLRYCPLHVTDIWDEIRRETFSRLSPTNYVLSEQSMAEFVVFFNTPHTTLGVDWGGPWGNPLTLCKDRFSGSLSNTIVMLFFSPVVPERAVVPHYPGNPVAFWMDWYLAGKSDDFFEQEDAMLKTSQF